MPTNILVGSETFRFNDLELHGQLTKIDDTREQDLAIHRYLKRDGAATERMGRQPSHFQATLYFVGDNWRADYTAFLAKVETTPDGTMIHPIFGRMKMTYQRAQSVVDVVQGANLVTVTAFFVENNIDTKLSATAAQGVPAKQQAVTSVADDLLLAAALYTTASAAVSNLSGLAESFASAAVDSSTTATADPSVTLQLAQVEQAAEAAIAALRADPLATADVEIYDSIVAVEKVYDACQQLLDAVLAVKPTIGEYTVPALMSVFTVASIFYGTDGLNRVDEILANNPDLPNPAAINPGTVLIMAAPTI